jgi:Lrp/AsnC family transcriptional regulator, regulator for asnA, asnC and gidA
VAAQNELYLDETDFQILEALQRDGRISFSELSKELGLAVSTISKRYNALSANGVVKIVGRVDPSKVGHHAYATIMLQIDKMENVKKVAEDLAKLPEVSFLALRTGVFHLEMNVVCRDNQHLLDLVNNHLDVIKPITKYETNMYLKVYKWGQSNLEAPAEVNSETFQLLG